MKLILSRQAERDAEQIAAWWRANRVEAPLLFSKELAAAFEAMRMRPMILRRYGSRAGKPVYRWLLRKSQQHIYYLVNFEAEEIRVLRIFSGRRSRPPRL